MSEFIVLRHSGNLSPTRDNEEKERLHSADRCNSQTKKQQPRVTSSSEFKVQMNNAVNRRQVDDWT